MGNDAPPGTSRANPGPAVTLVIPVHQGRTTHVCDLLATILAARPSRWNPREVILCTRDLPDLLATVTAALPSFPIPLRLVWCEEAPTLASIRNAGLRAVRTEWILAVDSDILLPADYFTSLEAEIDRVSPAADGYQMSFEPTPGASCCARYEAALDQMVLSRYIREDGVAGIAGGTFLARVETLLRHGGFREDMRCAEDVELGYRLFKAGVRIVYLPAVRVFHRYPNGIGDLLRRKIWHGSGYAMKAQYFPDLFRLLPPERRSGWRRLRAYSNPGFAIYVLVSMCAFQLGVLRERRRRRAIAAAGPRAS